jgi:hypothetical protein
MTWSQVTKVEKIEMRLGLMEPVASVKGKSEALERGTACDGEV